jgi:nicotinamidase-related amidase
MPEKNPDLHGNAPDKSAAALLIIDMINDLEFPGGEKLLEPGVAAADRIRALKERAHAAGVPVVYANDNFGRWQSDFHDVVQHVLDDGVRGQPLAERLRPGPDDYFVLKPKQSAFFATPLETLLAYLEVTRLILTGLTTNQCILFTAGDAHMRDLRLYVPADCVAAQTSEEDERALGFLQHTLEVDTSPAAELDLQALKAAG